MLEVDAIIMKNLQKNLTEITKNLTIKTTPRLVFSGFFRRLNLLRLPQTWCPQKGDTYLIH